MRLREALVMVCAFVLIPLLMGGLVVRSTKPNGSTSWQDGDSVTGSGLDADPLTLFNLVNGNLNTDNILDGGIAAVDLAAGAFVLSTAGDLSADEQGLADHCNNEVSCNKYPDRNAGSPTGMATDGAQEIFQLRRQLRRLSVGEAVALGDGDTATDEFKYGHWFDRPMRGANLLVNGDFELKSTASTACPDGWTDILGGGAPSFTQVAQTAPDGDGVFLRVNADTAAEQGCSQTLTSLKGSTQYLIVSRVRDTTGSCKVETTGADTGTDFTNLDRSITGAAFETVSAIVQTDATPTAVVLKLVTNDGATDDCDYDHVGIYEMNADPIPSARRVVNFQTSTEVGITTIDTGVLWTTLQNSGSTGDLQAEVTVPSPGCIIEVDAVASFDGADSREVAIQIYEEGSAVGVPVTSLTGEDGASVANAFVNTAPTVGTTYTYDLRAHGTSGTITQGVDDFDGIAGADAGAYIKVVMECGS